MKPTITLADLQAGDIIKFALYGTKWTVEHRREPERTLKGYLTFRTAKGSFKVISSRNWDIPIYSIRRACEAAQGKERERWDRQ